MDTLLEMIVTALWLPTTLGFWLFVAGLVVGTLCTLFAVIGSGIM